ncbi:signal peptidase I, partial [Bacteroides acidifaciens]|uniref:signal peptidase I n=2 Tax=Bacteroides TaxID=816 RepID=UPI0025A0D839
RNDILVFNFPYQMNRWDSVRMDVMQYYVKRCVALPGDTLEIRGGFYKVRGCDEQLGNYDAQQYLANLKHPEQHGIVVGTFPYDKQLGWTIREFGPLPIPKKGQTVMMNRTNCLLYRQLIGWEQKKKLRIKDGQIVLGDSVITQYRFKKNYYFVSGDHMANSQDSRYWGMLPEEYIVGKATRIWYSEDKFTEKPRWDRIMQKIK